MPIQINRDPFEILPSSGEFKPATNLLHACLCEVGNEAKPRVVPNSKTPKPVPGKGGMRIWRLKAGLCWLISWGSGTFVRSISNLGLLDSDTSNFV